MPCRCNSWESKSPEGPAPMIATWVRAMTGSLRCARQRSSAARRLLHDSGSDWYLSVYLSVTLMPAKLGRRHAGVSAEEAAEIGGILESELRRDCGYRAGDVHQAAARFQGESLLHDVEGSATGQAPADPVQAALGEGELPRIAFHRPVLLVVSLDQQSEAAQPVQFVPVGRRHCRRRLDSRRQDPQHRTSQPADLGTRTLGLPELLNQFVEESRGSRREQRVGGESDDARHQKKRGDRRLMKAAGHAQQTIEADGEHVALTLGVEPEAMHGACRDDDYRRTFELGLRSLEIGDHGTRGDIHALAQARVTMAADLPQILAASRLNVLDVQRIGRPDCSGRFAVQRITWNLPTGRPVHAPYSMSRARRSDPGPTTLRRRPRRCRCATRRT